LSHFSRKSRLAIILTHAALVQMLTFAVRPNLSYAVLDSSGSAALVGVIAAVFAVPGLLMALPAGHTVDRLGERPALILGAFALVISCLLAAFAGDSFAMFVLATVALGIGHLLSVLGDQTLIANIPENGNQDHRFGLYTFAAAVGQTLGPLMLLMPGGTDALPPIALLFYIGAGLGLGMLALSFWMTSSVRPDTMQRTSLGRTAVEMLRIPGMPPALATSAIVLASIDLFLAFAPALGHERGISTETVSIMLVVRSLMSMFSRLFLGQLIRLVGRRILLASTIAISAATLICMVLPLSPIWYVVISAVYGFAVGTCQPITMAWVSEITPHGSRGLAMSLRVVSNRAGQVVLPALLGTLAVSTGAGGVLALSGVALAGASWTALSVARNHPPDDDE
jgi:MFS family permease